jgi:thymidine phosphorylase
MKTDREAGQLARALVQIGLHAGVATEALISSMEWPLGRAVGNALEIVECVETLQGRGPDDLTQLSCYLAARMLVLAGLHRDEAAARAEVDRALASGRALERLAAMIEAQGGDPRVVDDPRGRLPLATARDSVRATRAGVLAIVDAEAIGRASMALGAGRDRVDDAIDPGVGVLLHAKPGERVEEGQPIADLVYRDPSRLEPARLLATQAIAIDDLPPTLPPLIRSRVDASSLR